MGVRALLGDRRACIRYQVVGELWASIEVREHVVIRNIAPGGALIETTLGSTARSIRAAYLRLPDLGPEVMVAVRHVSPLALPPTEDRCLLGVEFIKVTGGAREALDAFVQAHIRASSNSSPT